MKSTDLIDVGQWKEWSSAVTTLAPRLPGVYVLRIATGLSRPRLSGESDLIYIGSTKNLRQRLGTPLSPRTTERRDIGYRIRRIIEDKIARLEIAWKEFNSVPNARTYESKLLASYEEDHYEFPPLNRQEAGKKVRNAERLIANLSPEDQARLYERFKRSPSGATS